MVENSEKGREQKPASSSSQDAAPCYRLAQCFAVKEFSDPGGNASEVDGVIFSVSFNAQSFDIFLGELQGLVGKKFRAGQQRSVGAEVIGDDIALGGPRFKRNRSRTGERVVYQISGLGELRNEGTGNRRF